MPNTALIAGYPHRMGGHCGSGAMRDLLHWNGLGWDGPPSEGLVFALGGALSLTYIRSDDLTPPLYLVGRGGDFEVDLPERLGAEAEVLATDDPHEGWTFVRDDIDAGRPSLVWADIAELPYLRVQLRMSRHDIVIVGYDDEAGVAFVVDNDREEVQHVPYDALARARSSTSFPQPTRHTTYRITWPAHLPAIASAASSAFQQSADTMQHPTGTSIAGPPSAGGAHGLSAVTELASDLPTWADLSTNELEVHLFSLGAFIEKAGTGGGLFRRLLAEGCSEIARLTHDSATADLAVTAERCAQAWTALARSAVQRDVDAHTRLNATAETAGRLLEAETALITSLHNASASQAAACPS